jgi:hypothetical protein
MNGFIQAIRKEVEKLDPEALEVSTEGETPLVSYYQLESGCVDRILTRCQEKFDQHEMELFRDFINRHNEYDDVMTVVSKKEFIIKKRTQKDETARTELSAQRILTIP